MDIEGEKEKGKGGAGQTCAWLTLIVFAVRVLSEGVCVWVRVRVSEWKEMVLGRGSLCTLCIYLFYGCLASRMPAVAFYGPLNVLFAFAHFTFCAFSSLPLLLLKCSEMKCKFVWGPTQSCLTCSISFDIIVVAAHLGQLCDCDLLIGRRIGIIHLTIENTF